MCPIHDTANRLVAVVLLLPPLALASEARAQLTINEISFQPSRDSEWVELLNRGDSSEDITGFDITDQDDNTYRIPASLPAVPSGAFVLVVFDGKGPAHDDVDFSDNLAVLHTDAAALSGDVFEDLADSVRLYSDLPHDPSTLNDSLTWGDVSHFDKFFSLSFRPDSRFPIRPDETLGHEPFFDDDVSHWEIYQTDEVTRGSANPVNRPKWFAPPDGGSTGDVRPALSWRHSGVNIERYELVCDDDAFASPEIDVAVEDQQFRPESGLPEGTIFCRIRARDRDGETSLFTRIRFDVVVAAARAAAADLGIGGLQQRRDSRLVCLLDKGNPFTPQGSTGAHAWDAPHPVRGDDHDNEYCCHASLAMVASFYGGTLTQDRIAYECYAGRRTAGEKDDLGHGIGIWPTCASTSEPGKNLIEWALNLGAGTVTGIQNPNATSNCPDCTPGGKPGFAQVQGFIDARRPIIYVTNAPFHCQVIDGYSDPDGIAGTADDRIHVIDPWTGAETARNYNTFDFGANAAYFVPPAGANAKSDEASVDQDPDDDGHPRFAGGYKGLTYNHWGLMSFDEQKRFATDRLVPDTDRDCIDDKVEVWSYTFPAGRVADRDGDGARAEIDQDGDNHDLCDGDDREEDRNKDGELDLLETDPFVRDETLDGCQCTPPPRDPHYKLKHHVYLGKKAHLKIPKKFLAKLPKDAVYRLADPGTFSMDMESTGLPPGLVLRSVVKKRKLITGRPREGGEYWPLIEVFDPEGRPVAALWWHIYVKGKGYR